MEEKELKDLVFTNIDVAQLDTEHVYVFRMRPEHVAKCDHDTLMDNGKMLHDLLDNKGIKHIIVFGDTYDITELVTGK